MRLIRTCNNRKRKSDKRLSKEYLKLLGILFVFKFRGDIMNETIALLEQEWGLNYEAIKERFLDDRHLYLSCLESFTRDYGFERLEQALNNGDYDNALTQAFILKGVAANLGLNKMTFDLALLVSKLKNSQYDELKAEWNLIDSWHQKLIKLF